MASFTTVWVDVRKADYEKHQALFSTADEVNEDPSLSESVNMLTLSYYDVETEDFEVERAMFEANIPHDKHWDSTLSHSDGQSFFRVLENGQTDFKQFDGDENKTIMLDETIAAFEAGDIEAFLNAQKAKKTPISWEAQDVIMEKRDAAYQELSNLDARSLAKMVLFKCVSLAADGNVDAVDNTMTPQEYALIVNGKGQDEQIAYLLDNGYLVDEHDYTVTKTM